MYNSIHTNKIVLIIIYNYYTDDNNRVVLLPIEGHEHDFVNASYVDVS